VAIVLMLLAFVVVAGSRNGYSHVQDTISQLGATGAPAEVWFTVVNVVTSALIVVFAYGVQRRLGVGVATFFLLLATGLGAMLVGSLRCSGGCRVGTNDAHGIAADFTALMIVGFMGVAAWSLFRRSREGWFRTLTIALAVASLAMLIVLGVISRTKGGYGGLFERLLWGSAYAWVLAASLAIVLSVRRRYRPAVFDQRLVQRKILRSDPSCTEAVYVCCSIKDPAGAKGWLRAMIAPLGGLVRPDDEDRSLASVTLAFSHQGLSKLGVDYVPAFQPGRSDPKDPFCQGMSGRSDRLGDLGESAPTRWQRPWSSGQVDVLLWAEARDRRALDEVLQRLQSVDGAPALAFLVPFQFASARSGWDRGAAAQLSFKDGISQPWLPLRGSPARDGHHAFGGTLDPFGDWRPLAVGEFVLGETDESGDVSLVPEPEAIFKHGSFVVVRKLAQNVDAFAELVNSWHSRSSRLGTVGPDLAERMMGRLRDGHPLEPAVPGGLRLNDFTYGDDSDGQLCPLAAHIRRANPRDSLGFGTLLAARHRIIRRGRFYRNDPRAPERWGSGLIFVAVNARIDEQFELIQGLWLNDGNRQRVGTSRDFFAGSSLLTSHAVLQFESGPIVTDPIDNLVRTMGGEYFFAPSMAGLRALATWHSCPQEVDEILSEDRVPAAASPSQHDH
jgi:Dyp-type peroxidase family